MGLTKLFRSRVRWVLIAIGTLVVAISLAACGGDDDDDGGGEATTEATTEEAPEEITIGVATIGPQNDMAFSQSHVEGAELAAAEIPGAELTGIVDNREDPQSRIDAFETLSQSNNVIIGGSASFSPTADTVAPQFPDVYYIVSGGALTEVLHENVTAIIQEQGAAGYPAGVVAAELSQTGTIGAIGGAEIPPTVQSIAGFAAGATDHDPDIEVLENVIGNFNDVALAKEAAAAMIADGADQLYAFLDSGVQGVYQAAEESGEDVGVVNLIVADCESFPNTIGTVTQNNSAIISEAIKQHANGTLEPGAVFIGLEDPELQTHLLCPQYEENEEIAQLNQDAIDALIAGEVELPPEAITPPPDYAFSNGF